MEGRVKMCRRRAVRVVYDNGITAEVIFIREYAGRGAGYRTFVDSNELYDVTEPDEEIRNMPRVGELGTPGT